MTDLTVQRTLVKSSPELWSELSEAEGLARHLGEFGEIRITRAAPETTVAWEGDHASGTVEIEASGWGTKVTLTAAVEEPDGVEPAKPVAVEKPAEQPAELAEPAAKPVRLSEELDRIAERAQDSYWNELADWGDREVEEPAPKPRRGRFARFFRRRPRRESIEEALAAERLEDAGGPPAPEVSPKEEAASPAPPRTSETAAAEPAPPARQTAVAPQPDVTSIEPDHARAVLEHALDNLGAAHHRPFSRG